MYWCMCTVPVLVPLCDVHHGDAIPSFLPTFPVHCYPTYRRYQRVDHAQIILPLMSFIHRYLR